MSTNTPENQYTNDDLVKIIYQSLDRASDYATTALQETRRKSWDYFFNRPRGDEVQGRSQIQDTSVADMVESMMATIMPSYATDNVITFEPMGPDDEEQAEAESLAVNNIFVEDNDGFLNLSNGIKSALMQRNGIIKVWVEEESHTATQRFRAMSEQELAGVLANLPEDTQVTQNNDDGVRLSLTEKRRKLRVKAIEPAYIFIDPNQSDQNMERCQFIAERWLPCRSELVAMGVDKALVNDLPQLEDESITNNTKTNLDILAKFIDGVVDIGGVAPFSQQMIECHWVHMYMDRDGDGESELYRFLISNRKILLDEPADFIPYASGTGWIVPFRWSGLSVYDKLKQTQDERTNAKRQLADNLNHANNSGTWGVEGNVNVGDALNKKPGMHVRVRSPDAFGQLMTQDVTMSSINYLQYMDTVRAEQCGASLDLQQADDQLVKANVTAMSVDRQMSSREQIAGMINRNLAETLVRQTFLLIHKNLRLNWDGPIMFRHQGEWTETDPAMWPERTRINVNVGMSPGERARKASALSQTVQTQLALMQSGANGVLVDTGSLYRTLIDLGKAQEIDGIHSYWIDPDSPEAQEAAQAQAQQAEQMQQMQTQMAQMQVQIEGQKLELDKYKHDTELQYKYYDTNVDAEIEESKQVQEGIKHERDRATAEQMGGAGAAANGAGRSNEV